MEAKEVTALTTAELTAVQEALGLDDTATDSSHLWSAQQIMANLSNSITSILSSYPKIIKGTVASGKTLSITITEGAPFCFFLCMEGFNAYVGIGDFILQGYSIAGTSTRYKKVELQNVGITADITDNVFTFTTTTDVYYALTVVMGSTPTISVA